jgi:hypothetical protein
MKTHLWPITVALLLAISTGAAERPFAMQSRVAPPISKAAPKSSSAPAVVPYTIHVPDAVLADLKSRLAHARLADELPGVGWDYGMNPSPTFRNAGSLSSRDPLHTGGWRSLRNR